MSWVDLSNVVTTSAAVPSHSKNNRIPICFVDWKNFPFPSKVPELKNSCSNYYCLQLNDCALHRIPCLFSFASLIRFNKLFPPRCPHLHILMPNITPLFYFSDLVASRLENKRAPIVPPNNLNCLFKMMPLNNELNILWFTLDEGAERYTLGLQVVNCLRQCLFPSPRQDFPSYIPFSLTLDTSPDFCVGTLHFSLVTSTNLTPFRPHPQRFHGVGKVIFI